MSKLPSCEKDNLKSFTNILKAYGLDQQRPSNIGVVKSCRLKTQVLTYQQEYKRHLKVSKEEPHEIDQQNPNTRLAKEELQKLEHQTLDPNVIKDEIENQDSRVNIEGQLGKVAIDQLYNQKFKKFIYYHWV